MTRYDVSAQDFALLAIEIECNLMYNNVEFVKNGTRLQKMAIV